MPWRAMALDLRSIDDRRAGAMTIQRRIKPKFKTRNDAIVAHLRETAGAVAPLDPRMVVKRKAAELSTAMALIHGGDWRVLVDHDVRLVMIAPAEGPAGTQ